MTDIVAQSMSWFAHDIWNIMRYDTVHDLHWKIDMQAASLIHYINVRRTFKNVLNEIEESSGYGRDKRPEIEKLKRRK